ncbi:hypothetical protein CASFOL_040605 [Castilleja foliolosa]|uniref:RNase H type-1 domain-containing protein n=1 Tax=Castilleja foliolosa TaxID=1961234 RepID=A0ABD3BCR3_9LAMI
MSCLAKADSVFCLLLMILFVFSARMMLKNLDHLFINCPFIQQVFFCSFWCFNLSLFSNLNIKQWLALIFDYKNNNLFNSISSRLEFLVFTVALIDKTWFFRNQIAHGSAVPSIQTVVSLVTKNAKDHWNSITQNLQLSSVIRKSWNPPPSGWIKVNTDSSFANGDAVAGVVVKNHNGSILAAATYTHRCLNAHSAETLAILDACLLLDSFKVKNAIIESDCLSAISWINGASINTHWSANSAMEQIRRSWNSWPTWRFKFVSRIANSAPHALAKWASGCFFEGVVPLDLIPVSVFCDRGHPLVEPLFVY